MFLIAADNCVIQFVSCCQSVDLNFVMTQKYRLWQWLKSKFVQEVNKICLRLDMCVVFVIFSVLQVFAQSCRCKQNVFQRKSRHHVWNIEFGFSHAGFKFAAECFCVCVENWEETSKNVRIEGRFDDFPVSSPVFSVDDQHAFLETKRFVEQRFVGACFWS